MVQRHYSGDAKWASNGGESTSLVNRSSIAAAFYNTGSREMTLQEASRFVHGTV